MKYSFKKFFFAASIFLFLFDFSSCVIEPRPCKITYKSSYGNPPKTKKVPINTILTEEELPELFSEDYTFEGWYDGEVKAEPGVYKITTNVCFVAKWEKIPTFEYKVYHWQENLEDKEYSLYKTETLYGKADYLTQATAFNYEGFTSQDFEQKTITDDNKTEINIYYDRKSVTFTFENDDGSLLYTLTKKYWTPIEQPTNPEKEGFDFLRWEPELPDTFSGEDRTFVAKWVLEGVIVRDAYNVADTILALQGEVPHNIMVEGNIYSSTIEDIGKAMNSNPNAKINLDLSWATGLSVFPANYISTCNIGTLILPETITSIEGRFQSNKNLQSITIPENVNYFDAYIFAGCTQLTEIIVDPDNQYYSSSDDRKILLNKDKTSIHSYPSASGDITIPNYITSIGIGAFSHCENLTSITIPESVTTIEYNAFSYSGLTSVVIPNSVTSIGYNAFYDCTSLTSVELSDSITSIESYTFAWCNNLTSISIPESVTTIGYGAFSYCSALTSVVIPNSVTTMESEIFFECTNLESVTLPNNITSISPRTFANCNNLTSISIPESVTTIGTAAFSNCLAFTSVVIPNSVTTMESEIFWYCTNLETVSLPNSITSISPYTFYYCNNLRDITIPESVKTIGYQAFEGCSSLTNITIPESVETIEYNAFSYSGLTSIEIPNSVTSIGSNAFSDCTFLTSVKLSDSITSIESYTFAWCYKLTEVTIPDGITLIGLGAFQECNALTSISLPDSVTTIESNAFHNCYNLVSINIPNNVNYIGSDAFYNCKISEVTLPDSITTIGYRAYVSCTYLTTINIPASVTSIESAAFQGCTNLTTFIVDPNNQYYSTSNDNRILYNKDKTTLLSYPSAEGEISIPSTVEIIGDGAFAQSLITKVELPNSITSIGNSAFQSCSSLTEINISYGVTSIGDSAFYSCSSLTNIELPESVTSIGSSTFAHCTNLLNINILSSITFIPNNLFWCCSNLQTVTLPSTLETIDSDAFGYCYNLESINIPASVSNIYIIFRNCKKLKFFVDPNNNSYSTSDDNTMLFDKDKTTLLAYPSASGNVDISENETIKCIGHAAFFECEELTNLILPDSVVSIETQAFTGCHQLTSITLSNNLTSIAFDTFASCQSLTNITIPASVTKIVKQAFYGFYNLQTVTFEDTNDWYYTYNSDYSNGSEIDVTDESQNASYLRDNYDWYWYKGVGF